ncbi:MAG TPA: hypothetical protein VIJ47_04115, partial [Acidimicrobiales bacterium]
MIRFPRATRALRLAALTSVLAAGGVAFGPAPAYAARLVTRIDSESPTLSDAASAERGVAATAAGPLEPLQAQLQVQAAQTGRLR